MLHILLAPDGWKGRDHSVNRKCEETDGRVLVSHVAREV